MQAEVIEFFKRNPKAFAAHLVLDKVFDNATAASNYRKQMTARKVSAFTRDEYETWVANKAETVVIPSNEEKLNNSQ